MENFQVKHSQCDSNIFRETFSFGSCKYLLDLPLGDNRILLTSLLEYIHKFVNAKFIHALQYLLVRGSNKQQRRNGIISNFKKGETLSIS